MKWSAKKARVSCIDCNKLRMRTVMHAEVALATSPKNSRLAIWPEKYGAEQPAGQPRTQQGRQHTI
jgi:hypothetical protein